MGSEMADPIPEYIYRCKKASLLNSLKEELHNTPLIHEHMLYKLERLEELDYRIGTPVSASFSAAYCAVAVECTLMHLSAHSSDDVISTDSAYVKAINSIWRCHIASMESSSSSGVGCQLYSAELKRWSNELEASLSNPSVLKRLESYNSREDAISKLKAYLVEASQDLAAYFLGVAFFAASHADNCPVSVEFVGRKQEASKLTSLAARLHNALQRVEPFGNQSTELPNEENQIAEGTPNENQTDALVENPISEEAPIENQSTEALIENLVTEEVPSEFQTEEAPIENQITEEAPNETKEAPTENQTAEALIENPITEDAPNENQTEESLTENLINEVAPSEIKIEEAAIENQTTEALIENQITEEALNEDQTKAASGNQTTEVLIENQITEEAPNENQTKEAPIQKIADAPTGNVIAETDLRDQYVSAAASAEEHNESEQCLHEGASDHATKIRLPSPKRWKTSPLRKYEEQNIIMRRKKKRWSELEEDTLRSAVNQHGEGNWKLILSAHMDVFEERTDVDLKDKWRNLKPHRAN